MRNDGILHAGQEFREAHPEQESATPDVIDHLLKCIERSKKRPYHWKYGVVWLEPRKPKDITRE